MVDATIRVVPRNDLSSLADERFFISLCGAVLQGVQGDAVLLPGSGVSPETFPFSLAAGGGMHRVPEELFSIN